MIFEILYPPTKKSRSVWNKRFGLNAYYAGKHWSARKKDADELHMIARSAMNRAGIKNRLVKVPVQVQFFWDDNLDIDNHAAIGKAVLDSMKGFIIPDDNRKWVKKVSHEFWDGGKILVKVLPYREGGK